MGTKNEIKVVSKELTKYRVFLTTTIEIEVDVYAEDENEAQQLAEQEIGAFEYANDTIGVEIKRHWCMDISREGEQKVEIISVSCGEYFELYDTTAKETITLYAKEEDGFEDSENVFTDKQELIDYYVEDEDESNEEGNEAGNEAEQ